MLQQIDISQLYNPLLDEIVRQVAETLTHDDIWEAFIIKTEKDERKLKTVVRELFDEQEREVLQTLRGVPPPWINRRSRETDEYVGTSLFRPEEWAFRFQSVERPIVESSMENAALDALREVDSLVEGTIGIEFNVNNPRFQALVDQKVEKFSFEVNDTTLKQLKREFATGFAEGNSIPQFEQRIKKVFGIAKKSRLRTIAKTEILGTVNRGTLLGYQQSGVVKGKTWITTRKATVRDIHRIMEGETVPLNRRFSNGLMHPGDWNGPPEQIINCECTMTAEVKE